MNQQSQPIIPVTMPYGGGSGYATAQICNDVNRSTDHVRAEIHRSTDRVDSDLHRSTDRISGDVLRSTDRVSGEVHRSTDQVRDDVHAGTSVIRSDLANDTATIIANLQAQAFADQAQTRSSQIESRQAVERGNDYITKQAQDNIVSGLLATQSSSTQGLLATQNSMVASLTAIKDAAIASSLGFAAMQVQSEKLNSGTNQIVYTQSQAQLLGQKDREVNASNQLGAIQLLAQQNFQASQLQAAKDTSILQLQACEYNKSAELQASTYKSYLENYITKTSSDTVLAGFKNTAEILEKLCECCCEQKAMHAATQNIVVQNGNANNSSIQQGYVNTLQQSLAAAQQEALLAKFAALSSK